MLTRLGARTFLLLSHLFGSHNKYQLKSASTEARQRVGTAKQFSKLSLGQNKDGKNITTPHGVPAPSMLNSVHSITAVLGAVLLYNILSAYTK